MTRRRPTSGDRKTRFGVYLDAETHKALLKAAIDEGVSATELVERLIKGHLGRPVKRTTIRREG
jgi:hypothetical protein